MKVPSFIAFLLVVCMVWITGCASTPEAYQEDFSNLKGKFDIVRRGEPFAALKARFPLKSEVHNKVVMLTPPLLEGRVVSHTHEEIVLMLDGGNSLSFQRTYAWTNLATLPSWLLKEHVHYVRNLCAAYLAETNESNSTVADFAFLGRHNDYLTDADWSNVGAHAMLLAARDDAQRSLRDLTEGKLAESARLYSKVVNNTALPAEERSSFVESWQKLSWPGLATCIRRCHQEYKAGISQRAQGFDDTANLVAARWWRNQFLPYIGKVVLDSTLQNIVNEIDGMETVFAAEEKEERARIAAEREERHKQAEFAARQAAEIAAQNQRLAQQRAVEMDRAEREFAAQQEAKGLVYYDGSWITPEARQSMELAKAQVALAQQQAAELAAYHQAVLEQNRRNEAMQQYKQSMAAIHQSYQQSYQQYMMPPPLLPTTPMPNINQMFQQYTTPQFTPQPFSPTVTSPQNVSEYKYQGMSGTMYKYDLSSPLDQIQYSIDPLAHINDQIKAPITTGVQMDQNIGQYGAGIK